MDETVKRIAIPTAADGAPHSSGTQLAARAKTLGRDTLPRSRVDVAVRAREIVVRGGRIHRTLHVFCPREERSLSRDACAGCDEHRTGLDEGARIGCGFTTRQACGDARPDGVSIAARILIGMAMDGIRCVRSDVPLAELPSPTHGDPLVIVDQSGVPIGAVRSEVLRERPLIAHARPSDLMVPVLTVGEGEPLTKALCLMAAERARHICVVSDDQTATGLISDVAALKWLTRQTRALAEEG